MVTPGQAVGRKTQGHQRHRTRQPLPERRPRRSVDQRRPHPVVPRREIPAAGQADAQQEGPGRRRHLRAHHHPRPALRPRRPLHRPRPRLLRTAHARPPPGPQPRPQPGTPRLQGHHPGHQPRHRRAPGRSRVNRVAVTQNPVGAGAPPGAAARPARVLFSDQARIKPSHAIIAGLAGTAIVLFIFDFALLLAIPGVKPAMRDPSLIPDLLTSALGSGFAKLFLDGALVAVFSTAIATLATIVRMIYGMARNNQLPASGFLTKLSGRTTEPIGTIVVAAILSILPLIFIKRIPVIVASITALIIIPYMLVLGSLLVRRLRGWPQQRSKFSLGRWGLPVTIAGLVWTVIILLDAAWPREVTNPKLGPLPVIEDLGIGTIIVGLIWWFVSLRHKSSTPADARAEPAIRK